LGHIFPAKDNRWEQKGEKSRGEKKRKKRVFGGEKKKGMGYKTFKGAVLLGGTITLTLAQGETPHKKNKEEYA